MQQEQNGPRKEFHINVEGEQLLFNAYVLYSDGAPRIVRVVHQRNDGAEGGSVEYVTEIPQLALHTLVSGNEPKKATEEVVDRAIQLFRDSNWPQVATQKTGLLHREQLPL